MLRYQAAAIALKAFGLNETTRAFYRRLGNRVRGNEKSDLSGSYAERGAWLVSKLRGLGITGTRRLSAVELGTGWMHFYGVVLSLIGIEKVDLYDVWENRQFHRLKNSFADFDRQFDTLGLAEMERGSAAAKIESIRAAHNFDDVYRALGMSYTVDGAGVLGPLASSQYDVACSLDVLEHVRADKVDSFLRAIWGALKPGGVSLHQIGLDDHLTHYDASCSPKQYLAYGARTYGVRFENDIQYTNLLSYDYFRAAFRRAGFEEIECTAQQDGNALRGIKVAPRFKDQSEESLRAIRAFIVHRKPSNAA